MTSKGLQFGGKGCEHVGIEAFIVEAVVVSKGAKAGAIGRRLSAYSFGD